MKLITTAAFTILIIVPGLASAQDRGFEIQGTGAVWDGQGDARVDDVEPEVVRSIRAKAVAGITMNAFVFAAALAGIALSPMLMDVPMLPPTLVLYSVAAPFVWGARSAALRAQGLPGTDGHIRASVAGYVCMMVSGTTLSTPLGWVMPPMRTVFWANLSGNAMASLIIGATALRQSRKIAGRDNATTIVPFATGTAGQLVVGVTGTF